MLDDHTPHWRRTTWDCECRATKTEPTQSVPVSFFCYFLFVSVSQNRDNGANPQEKEDTFSEPKWQQIMGLPCLLTQCKASLLCFMCYLGHVSHACEMQVQMMLLCEDI